MFIDRNVIGPGAVRRSGIERALYVGTFIPLLRTAPAGRDPRCYKHFTPLTG